MQDYASITKTLEVQVDTTHDLSRRSISKISFLHTLLSDVTNIVNIL